MIQVARRARLITGMGAAAVGCLMSVTPAAAQSSCLTAPLSQLPPSALDAPSALGKQLDSLLPIAPEMRGGALQDQAVRAALAEACAETGASEWLGHACALPPSGDALIALRSALVLDVVALAARAQESAASPETRSQLGLMMAVLEALALDPTPRGVAQRLLVAAHQTALCEANRAGVLDPAVPAELQRAAAVVWALSRDLQRMRSDAEAARQTAEATLRQYGDQALDQARAAAVQQLVAALAELEAAQGEPRAALAALLRVIEAAERVAGLPGSAASDAANQVALLRTVATALVEGERAAFEQAAIEIVERESAGAAQAFRATFQILRARSEEEVRSIPGLLFKQLGPWAEDVIFDINVGAASFSSTGDYSFAGDLTLGYAGGALGAVGRGSFTAYDFSTAAGFSQTERAGGSADAWWVSDPGTVRYELRLSGGGYLYNTDTSIPNVVTLAEEQNIMGRGALLAGLRLEPDADLGFGVWVGGGAQLDIFEALTVETDGTVSDASETAVSLDLQARLRFQAALIPRWITVRARVDAERFSITRDASNVELTALTTAPPPGTVTESTQTEVYARGFLDAEVARFGGFVPSIGGGVDHVSQSGSAGDQSATVPVFHAGLRRVVY